LKLVEEEEEEEEEEEVVVVVVVVVVTILESPQKELHSNIKYLERPKTFTFNPENR